MAGTSDQVDVWLLLEYRPAWKAKALPASDLAPATKDWLQRSIDAFAGQGLRARPQLVRQPELDTDQVRLLVGHGEQLWEFAGTGYDFLHELDLAGLLAGAAATPAGARLLREPRYFVCTNGQRDLCCARFGLPVYAALREHVGERVWQATHLGGHRFAPNVLVLPAGALYGRVGVAAVPDFVATVDAGGLAFDHLRGRSRYPKHVQAAEALLAEDGLRLLHVDGDAERATVTFAAADGRRQAQVARSDPEPALTSCGDAEPSETFIYRAAD